MSAWWRDNQRPLGPIEWRIAVVSFALCISFLTVCWFALSLVTRP